MSPSLSGQTSKLFSSVILAFSCLLLLAPAATVAWTYSDASEPQAPVAENSSRADQRVKLGVFMESRCPDSRRFFNNQLVPTYRQIGSIINLNLVPFGHARTLENGRMICQHGPRECEGNRRMACVQSRAKNQSQVVETIGCLFSGELSVQSCIESNLANATYEDIEKCTKSEESFQMMLEAEKQTGRLGYVPHLTVNNEWSNHIQNEAENELKKFVCQSYRGQKSVESCKSLVGASSEPTSEQPAF